MVNARPPEAQPTTRRTGGSRRRSVVKAVRSDVLRSIARLGLPTGARIVVGVSGGPDSTVLLDALASIAESGSLELVVAHFHHGIRGESADGDMAFVEDLAGRYGAAFRSGRGDAAALARRSKRSLEDAARRLRRSFLEQVRAEAGGRVIALGHTMDDQAETVLLNFLRGAGPRGLGGMPERGPGQVVRPLLRFRRTTIETYLAEVGIAARTDETNSEWSFRRNRVRGELIPLLAARYNPAIVERLARGSGLFREVDRFLRRSGRDRLSPWAGRGEDVIRIPAAVLRSEPRLLQREIVRTALDKVAGGLEGVTQAHVAAVLKLAGRAESKQVDLPGGLRAERVGPIVEIGRADRPRADSPDATRTPVPVELTHAAEYSWGGGILRVTLLDVSGEVSPAIVTPGARRSAVFDRDRLPDKLVLRAPLPGDRIRLFGSGGRKKLSDVFIDAKVPRKDRGLRPVLASADAGLQDVLWAVSVARSGAAPVQASSCRIAHFEWFGK